MLKISESLLKFTTSSPKAFWSSLSPLNQLIAKFAAMLFASLTLSYIVYKKLILKIPTSCIQKDKAQDIAEQSKIINQKGTIPIQEQESILLKDRVKLLQSYLDDIIKFRISYGYVGDIFHGIQILQIEKDNLNSDNINFLRMLNNFYQKFERNGTFDDYNNHLSDQQKVEVSRILMILKVKVKTELNTLNQLKEKFNRLKDEDIKAFTTEQLESLITKLKEKLKKNELFTENEVKYIDLWREFELSFENFLNFSLLPSNAINYLGVDNYFSIYKYVVVIIEHQDHEARLRESQINEMHHELYEIHKMISNLNFNPTSINDLQLVDPQDPQHVQFIKACHVFANKYALNPYNPLKIQEWKEKFEKEGFSVTMNAIINYQKHPIGLQE